MKNNSTARVMRNKEDVLGIINEYIGFYGSQKMFANACDISTQYLNDIIHGRRNISKKVLDTLDMEKVEVYFYKQ